MAHADVTTWTCDRCGRLVQVESATTPKGWESIHKGSLDEGVTVGLRSWEVCAGCADQIGRFMEAGRLDVAPEPNHRKEPDENLH